MSFLRAEWRKLAIANYTVDPAILRPYLPKHTELDLWNGVCYVSLVGFMFLNTRIMGVKVPFHVDFEEVNLRFYVKHWDGSTWKRGVVFIKEIVPKPAITFIANTIYKEHYQTKKMGHRWSESNALLEVEYRWNDKKKVHFMALQAMNQPQIIAPNSETEFITEHYWGYSKHGSKTVEYEVTHPRWEHYPVISFDIQVDFGLVYGSDFTDLSHATPVSVMLAEGSDITVEQRRFL